MSITLSADSSRLDGIPDPDTIRRRLAVVMTEASVLRSQLRVSVRMQRERERLAALAAAPARRES